MTCATCDGKKRNPAGVMTVPCPDCAPKPFAEVALVSTGDGDDYEMRIGGQFIEGAYVGQRDVLQDRADAINAAVEEREAKLSLRIERLRLAAAELADAGEHLHAEARQMGASTTRLVKMGTAREKLRLLLLDELENEPAGAVSGDVACGLAFDLGAARAKLEGTWGVLLDALIDKGGESHELAWELAGALGIGRTTWRPLSQRLSGVSTGDLSREIERRIDNAHKNKALSAALEAIPPGPVTATEMALRESNAVMARRREEVGQMDHATRLANMAFERADLPPTEERFNFALRLIASTRPPLSVEYLARSLLEREGMPPDER